MPSFEEWYTAIKKSIEDEQRATESQKENALKTLEKSMPFIKAIDNKANELGLSKEESYILGYLLEHSQAKEEKLSAYDFTIIQLTSMMFVHEHKTEIQDLFDIAKRKAFIDSLTDADFESIKIDPTENRVILLKQAEEPSIDDILEIIGFGNAVHLYSEKAQGGTQRKKGTNRTRAKAGDIYKKIPQNLAIPTLREYQHGLSLYQDGKAYLQPLTSTDGLKFQNGLMYFSGEQMRRVSEVELQNMKTKEGIENIDLALLRVFYSIILSAFEATNCKTLKPNITLFVPDLAEFLGLQRNLNKQDLARVISKTQQFHNIVGVMHETRNGKPTQSLYQVLNFESYDDKKNTITFSSPYMNHVIETVYNIAIRRDKKGAPRLKSNGEPMRLVSHSYLVKSEISKERNKTAVENVIIITTLIEQAGENVPRIKASTIIERNPQLQQRLENSTNKRQFLKRTFEKTWELLRTKTRLQEVYKNIQLPDPKDPANIPTVATLESTVFSFPHDGKKQEK